MSCLYPIGVLLFAGGVDKISNFLSSFPFPSGQSASCLYDYLLEYTLHNLQALYCNVKLNYCVKDENLPK